jgi:sugar lactone lactonase YvrE
MKPTIFIILFCLLLLAGSSVSNLSTEETLRENQNAMRKKRTRIQFLSDLKTNTSLQSTSFLKPNTIKVPPRISHHPSKISLASISPNLFMKLIAGTNAGGYSGDNGPATSAQLDAISPWVDSAGNVYVLDQGNIRIRKIDSAGIVSTFGGTGVHGTTGASGPVGSTPVWVPWSMVGDAAGSYMFFSDKLYVWKYTVANNQISVFAHSKTLSSGFSGDGGPASSAQLNVPQGLWLTTSGILYVSDNQNHRIRKISTGIISTVAGSTGPASFSGDGAAATSAKLNFPTGVYLDSTGRIFIADTQNNRIRVVDATTSHLITTFAGSGVADPFNGDNLPALSATLSNPWDVKGDSAGNIYIADTYHGMVRLVDTSGIMSVLFGGGPAGFTSGISPRTSALNAVVALWLDSSANIYFCDQNSIRRSIIVSSPTSQPTGSPTCQPSGQPSRQPIGVPSSQPSDQPSRQPIATPSSQPSRNPTDQPSTDPTAQPSVQPSSQPSKQPMALPTTQPSGQPTIQPSFFIGNTNLKDGLVAYYPFDGTANDKSGNGNNGMIRGGVIPGPDRFGKLGGAFSFDGTSGYIEIPGQQFNFPVNMSISFWMFPAATQSGSNTVIVDKSEFLDHNGDWNGFLIQGNSLSPNFGFGYVSVTGSYVSTGIYSFSSTSWSHFVITKLGKYIEYYVNGVHIQTIVKSSITILPSGNLPLMIGAMNVGHTFPATNVKNQFTGSLDELFFYNRSLSAQEVALLYNFDSPTSQPSRQPSSQPSVQPTTQPSKQPVATPSSQPSRQPISQPSTSPTIQPSSQPSAKPSRQPTTRPSSQPTTHPSTQPSSQPNSPPSAQPTTQPTNQPSSRPTRQPSGRPSSQPSLQPSLQPFSCPTSHPTIIPTVQPSSQPSSQPNSKPSTQPTRRPSRQPSSQPTNKPTNQPMTQPTRQPIAAPSSQPSSQPVSKPSTKPSSQPSSQPSNPSSVPTGRPSSQVEIFMELVVGTGIMNQSDGDDFPATAAAITTQMPWVDPQGNIYLPDNFAQTIRKVNIATGIITTFGGMGTSSFAGASGPIRSVYFYVPVCVVGDAAGTVLYISDLFFVWRYNFSTNIASVFAHLPSLSTGYDGDGGPATSAQLSGPQGLWLTTAGDLYIADTGNSRIRMISSASSPLNVIDTVAGGGTNGDGHPATDASLNFPQGVFVDSVGRMFIADTQNAAIRMVDTNNIISTLGGGMHIVDLPVDVKGDSLGNIYFADQLHCKLGMMDRSGIVSTFIGTPGICGFSSGITTRSSKINQVTGIWVDSSGTVYFSDGNSIHRTTTVSSPTSQPSRTPSRRPTTLPTVFPTRNPTTQPSNRPSTQPTERPSGQPLSLPSSQPSSFPTNCPSTDPTTQPVGTPSAFPTSQPSNRPTRQPSSQPSDQPSTRPSRQPSSCPSSGPSRIPSCQPVSAPSSTPSRVPSSQPISRPSDQPSSQHSNRPTISPTNQPSNQPSSIPSRQPTSSPSSLPSSVPSSVPSERPSAVPSTQPSTVPTGQPTLCPTSCPSTQPSSFPSSSPTTGPTASPSSVPTGFPSTLPSCSPSNEPTSVPSKEPSNSPSVQPTLIPTEIPSSFPSNHPSVPPSTQPTSGPVSFPTTRPTGSPSSVPSNFPVSFPTSVPTGQPSLTPSKRLIPFPSSFPSAIPSKQPIGRPTSFPTSLPRAEPTRQPSSQPSMQPTTRPSRQPNGRPGSQPSRQPSSRPTLPSSKKPILVAFSPSSPQASATTSPTASPTATFSVLTRYSAGFKGFILPLNNFIQSSDDEGTGVHQNINTGQSSTAFGSSFIVFGRKEKYSDFSFGDKEAYSDYTTIKDPGQGGMVPDKASRSVSVLGDINGDSLPDLLIGDPLSSTCFVYLGRERNRFMNLPLSFVITSGDAEANDFFGWATAALSDMNNDGKDDFMVSAIYSNTVYVIYGRNNFPNNLVVSRTNSFKGFRIKGSATDIGFGMSLSSAGDFNNDGWKDFLISSMSVSTSLSSQNVIYILFGNHSFFYSSSSISADIVMDRLPSYSYLKVIAPKSSFAGFSLSSLGDINQDGFDDIIIGSIPYQGGYSTQKSYVLYGKQSSFPVNNNNNVLLLSEMKSGEEGFTIAGGGFAVAGPGDVNEDGLNDILIVNYQQWQGKENSYLLFFPIVGNITSPPTFLPSSLPSNHPSSFPSSRPSVAVIVDSPTNRPSSSVPSVRLFSGTFPPALSATLPPTKAAQTIKPSRIPSVKPSTRLPTTKKPITLSPTVVITEKPSFRLTVRPSLVPTRIPSSVTARPSTRCPSCLPSSFPSSSPTESVSTPFTTVTITGNGSYEISASSEDEGKEGDGRGGKKEIIISATGNVVIYNEGGKNHEKQIYRIIPMENTITIEDFNRDRDILDLIHFPAFQSLSDLPYRSPPITFFLSEKQRIILANLGMEEEENEMELTEDNFYFFQSSLSQADSTGTTPSVRIDSSLIISLVILLVCATLVVLLLCLPSYETEEMKKKKMTDEVVYYESSPADEENDNDDDRMEQGKAVTTVDHELMNDEEENEEEDISFSFQDDDEEEEDEEDDETVSDLLNSDIDSFFDNEESDNEKEDDDHNEKNKNDYNESFLLDDGNENNESQVLPFPSFAEMNDFQVTEFENFHNNHELVQNNNEFYLNHQNSYNNPDYYYDDNENNYYSNHKNFSYRYPDNNNNSSSNHFAVSPIDYHSLPSSDYYYNYNYTPSPTAMNYNNNYNNNDTSNNSCPELIDPQQQKSIER